MPVTVVSFGSSKACLVVVPAVSKFSGVQVFVVMVKGTEPWFVLWWVITVGRGDTVGRFEVPGAVGVSNRGRRCCCSDLCAGISWSCGDLLGMNSPSSRFRSCWKVLRYASQLESDALWSVLYFLLYLLLCRTPFALWGGGVHCSCFSVLPKFTQVGTFALQFRAV